MRSLSPNEFSCAKGQTCAPISLRVFAGSDESPITDATVSFRRCDEAAESGFSIETASVVTNSQGVASTSIKAPSKRGVSDCIVARVEGTSLSVKYVVHVSDPSSSRKLRIGVSTGTLMGEGSFQIPAGQAFAYRFSIVDDNGDTVTSVDNQTLSLLFTYASIPAAGAGAASPGLTPSWTGQSAVSDSQISCTFVKGVCNSPSSNYRFTDSRKSVLVTVTPISAAGDFSPGSVALSVMPGAATGFALSSAPGGPAANAVALLNTQGMSADEGAKNYYLTIVDAAGNYLRDAGASDTSGMSVFPDGTVIKAANCVQHPATSTVPFYFTFSPQIAGSGNVTISKVGMTPGVLNVAVTSGKVAKFSLETAGLALLNGNYLATAGVAVSMSVKALDQWGNAVTNLSCPANACYLEAKLANGASSPVVSGGANTAWITGTSPQSIDTGAWVRVGDLSFNAATGVSVNPLSLILRDASKMPSLSVRGNIYDPTLRPLSAVTLAKNFIVLRGGFHHLNLVKPDGGYCMLSQLTQGGSCLSGLSVDSPVEYTLRPEDAGGNVLLNTPLDTLNTSIVNGTHPSEWTLKADFNSSRKIVFDPTYSGSSYIVLRYTSGGLIGDTTIGVQNTQAGAPVDFVLSSDQMHVPGPGLQPYFAFEGNCMKIAVGFVDGRANPTRVAAGVPISLSFSASASSSGHGEGGSFYRSLANCTAGSGALASGAVTFTSSDATTEIYFKPANTVGLPSNATIDYTLTLSGVIQGAGKTHGMSPGLRVMVP